MALPAPQVLLESDAGHLVEVSATGARPALPWAFGDLRRVSRAVATGGVGLFLAWVVASGTTEVDKQGYAVAGGVLASAFVLAGCAGWLVSGLHNVRAERARLLSGIAELLHDGSEAVAVAPTHPGLVTVRGMSRVHRATCLMARGKDVRRVRSAEGLAPCPICLTVPGDAA